MHGARTLPVPDPDGGPRASIARRQCAPIKGLVLSSRSAKHRKPKRGTRHSRSARHRRPSPIANALQNHPGKTAAAVTGAVLIAAAAPIATHWAGDVGVGQAAVLSKGHDGELPGASDAPAAGQHAGASGSPAASHSSAGGSAGAAPAPDHAQAQAAAVYKNPFRDIKGMIPERID